MNQKDVFDTGLISDLIARANSPPGPVRTVHHDDIGYTVLARLGAGGCVCHFQCHKMESAGATGEPGDPRWYGDSSHGSPAEVFNTEESPALEWDDKRLKPYLAGEVKWDGCSNWGYYADPDGVMLHHCGRAQAAAVGVLIDRCYDLGREMMGPEHVHDLGMFDGSGPLITDDPVAVELARITALFRKALEGYIGDPLTPEAVETYKAECVRAAGVNFQAQDVQVLDVDKDHFRLRVVLPAVSLGDGPPATEGS